MDNQAFIFVVVVGTAFVLSLIAIVGFLMVVNTNRRHRHRAELAEADLRRESAVMRAEREATDRRDGGRADGHPQADRIL